MARKPPIGIQSFESMRRDGYVYVDKTACIHRLVSEGKPYFLIRPRRFGKSLLVSTMRAYFKGRRELFEGLDIERLEGDGPDTWVARPVFHLDFNGADYTREDGPFENSSRPSYGSCSRCWGDTCTPRSTRRAAGRTSSSRPAGTCT